MPTKKGRPKPSFHTGEAGVEPALTVLETAFLPLEDSPLYAKKEASLPSLPQMLYAPSKPHIPLLQFQRIPGSAGLFLWSSPRPISSSQLHTLLHFHLCPIYLVVFKGVYFLRMGELISRGASRLDAFSVYPFQTWLPGHAPGGTTGAPEVRPSRSSRTKDSSSQFSYAHAG